MKQGQRVVLHVGAMKTGTSYLQQVLAANPDALAADGMGFPGRHGWLSQIHAARDVVGIHHGDTPDPRVVGAWDRLLADMDALETGSVVSMEFFSFVNEPGARRVIEALAPAEVDVVLTVRDAGRVVPAQWQETVQNFSPVAWPAWCSGVLDASRPRAEIRRNAMRALRIPHMVEVWSSVVPAGRFHVVTVPPSSSPTTLLWERFAAAAGLTCEAYRTDVGGANPSLGHVSAELVRRLNVRLADLPHATYVEVVKNQLSKHVLATRRGEPKVVLPQVLERFVRDCDERARQVVAESGAVVHGDLDDLVLRGQPVADVYTVSDQELFEAATYAVRGLRAHVGDRLGPLPPDPTRRWARLRTRRQPIGQRRLHLMDDLEAVLRLMIAARAAPRSPAPVTADTA